MNKIYEHNALLRHQPLIDGIIDKNEIVFILDDINNVQYFTNSAKNIYLLCLGVVLEIDLLFREDELIKNAYLNKKYTFQESVIELEYQRFRVIRFRPIKAETDNNLEMFKAVADQSSEAILVISAPLESSLPIIEYVNHSFTRLTGYSTNEIIGQFLDFMSGPKTDSIFIENLSNKLLSGCCFSGKSFNYKKNGTEFLIEWKVKPINDSYGITRQSMVTIRDVNKNELEQSRVAESEYRYRNLVNNSPMPIIILTEDKIKFINYSAAKTLGGDILDFLEKPFKKLLSNTKENEILNYIQLRQNRILRSSKLKEIVLKKIDGSLIYTEMLTASVEYKGFQSIQIMFLDITEKKQLLNEQLKLRGIITESFEEIYTFDTKTLRFKYANKAALKNTGYSLDEITKLTRYDLRPNAEPALDAAEMLKTIKSNQEPIISHGFNKRKDGSVYRAEVKIQYMDLEDEEVYVAVVNDISNQYKLQQRRDLVNSINEQIVKREATKDILNVLIGKIAEKLNFDLGEVWRYEDDDIIRQAYSATNNEKIEKIISINRRIQFIPGEGIIGGCYKKGEVVWTNVFEKSKVKLHRLHINMGINTVVAFPLIVDDEVIGVGKLYATTKIPYDSEVAGLLMTLGNQLAQFKKRKNIEEKLINSLREKEGLLKEIHHRVKNNLQTVSSLLYLRSTSISDPEIKRFFTESQNRINAITFTHEKLLNAQSYTQLDIKTYLEDLIDNIYQTHINSMRHIELKKTIESHILTTDVAMNCGLILNELLTNAFDHAFGKNEDGSIKISFKQIKNKFRLIVHDSGRGFNYANMYEDSVGVQLVHLFTSQLRGKMNVDSSKGTRIEIIF